MQGALPDMHQISTPDQLRTTFRADPLQTIFEVIKKSFLSHIKPNYN